VESRDGAIRNVFLVANPDKLSHIPSLQALEASRDA
jgi:hypothetical protein